VVRQLRAIDANQAHARRAQTLLDKRAALQQGRLLRLIPGLRVYSRAAGAGAAGAATAGAGSAARGTAAAPRFLMSVNSASSCLARTISRWARLLRYCHTIATMSAIQIRVITYHMAATG
jgi:hypothetical protein